MTQSTTNDLLERALALPADERLALANQLIDSVEAPEDPEWTAAWAKELDRRAKELDRGAAKTIPWEQVKADVQTRLQSK